MYELDYISAANSTIKEIKEARENLLNMLSGEIKQFNKEKKKATANNEISIQDSLTEREMIYKELYKYIKSGLNISIDISKIKNKEFKLTHIENLIKKARALDLPLNIYVSGYSQFGKEKEHVKMLFNQDTINNFIALNNYLLNNGASPLRFMEDPIHPQNAWTLNQVVEANQEIDSIVNMIKIQKFSPFETIAFIHYYITNKFQYSENEESPLDARSIIGVLNTNSIVCMGYAELTKAIIDKLNMPGLESSTIESVIQTDYPKLPFFNDGDIEFDGFAHQQNLIKIDDPKYKIKGSYVSDACWDSKDENFENGKGFAHCMFPIDDLFNLNGRSFQQIDHLRDVDAVSAMNGQLKVPLETMPLFKKIGKYKPISIEKYQDCVYNMLRKIYPSLSAVEIRHLTEDYMLVSASVAYQVFNDNAKSDLAKFGRENLQFDDEELEIGSSEIVK